MNWLYRLCSVLCVVPAAANLLCCVMFARGLTPWSLAAAALFAGAGLWYVWASLWLFRAAWRA